MTATGPTIGPPPGAGPGGPPTLEKQHLPPITELAVATLGLIIVGGIYMAAHVPHAVNLAPAIGLLAAAGVLVVVNVFLLTRISEFAWDVFWRVAGWTFLAYLVIGGMLMYVFYLDHIRGAPMGVLFGMLFVFMIDVPLIVSFTVARYQPVRAARPAPAAAAG